MLRLEGGIQTKLKLCTANLLNFSYLHICRIAGDTIGRQTPLISTTLFEHFQQTYSIFFEEGLNVAFVLQGEEVFTVRVQKRVSKAIRKSSRSKIRFKFCIGNMGEGNAFGEREMQKGKTFSQRLGNKINCFSECLFTLFAEYWFQSFKYFTFCFTLKEANF